jgi:hypothetical protein
VYPQPVDPKDPQTSIQDEKSWSLASFGEAKECTGNPILCKNYLTAPNGVLKKEHTGGEDISEDFCMREVLTKSKPQWRPFPTSLV